MLRKATKLVTEAAELRKKASEAVRTAMRSQAADSPATKRSERRTDVPRRSELDRRLLDKNRQPKHRKK